MVWIEALVRYVNIYQSLDPKLAFHDALYPVWSISQNWMRKKWQFRCVKMVKLLLEIQFNSKIKIQFFLPPYNYTRLRNGLLHLMRINTLKAVEINVTKCVWGVVILLQSEVLCFLYSCIHHSLQLYHELSDKISLFNTTVDKLFQFFRKRAEPFPSQKARIFHWITCSSWNQTSKFLPLFARGATENMTSSFFQLPLIIL